MKCLETRTTIEGFKRRRYEDNGARFTTIEVPIDLWKKLCIKAIRKGIRADRAAEIQRAKLLRQNEWSVDEISVELGVSMSTVVTWLATK